MKSRQRYLFTSKGEYEQSIENKKKDINRIWELYYEVKNKLMTIGEEIEILK
jgi:hypothetical protein